MDNKGVRTEQTARTMRTLFVCFRCHSIDDDYELWPGFLGRTSIVHSVVSDRAGGTSRVFSQHMNQYHGANNERAYGLFIERHYRRHHHHRRNHHHRYYYRGDRIGAALCRLVVFITLPI